MFLNTRRLCHILDNMTDMVDLPVALSLDIEKAFDTLGWDYLQSVLEHFGLGPNCLRWIKLLYRAPRARGRPVSDGFDIQRGTREGCPLSSIIFVLAMEPLACHCRARKMEWGILEGGQTHVVSLYADDAILYLCDSQQALPAVFQLLDRSGRVAGQRVN